MISRQTYFVDISLGRSFYQYLKNELYLDVEFHLDHFKGDVPDTEWITEISVNNWIAVTADKRIKLRPNEKEAVKNAELKMFILRLGKPNFEKYKIAFSKSKESIFALAKYMPGPFISSITAQQVQFKWLGE